MMMAAMRPRSLVQACTEIDSIPGVPSSSTPSIIIVDLETIQSSKISLHQ